MNLMTLGQSWPSCPHRYLHIDHLKSSEGRGRTGSVDLSVIRANIKVEDSNRVVTLSVCRGPCFPQHHPSLVYMLLLLLLWGARLFPAVTLASAT